MKRYMLCAGVWVASAMILVNAQTGGSGAGGQSGATSGSSVSSAPQSPTPGIATGVQNPSGGQSTVSSSSAGGTVQSSSSGQSTVTSSSSAPNAAPTSGAQTGTPPTNNTAGVAKGVNQPAGLVSTNQVGATSQSAVTNQGGFAATNANLTPTGRTPWTNGANWTNEAAFGGTNGQSSAARQDQALTSGDRIVLVSVREKCMPELRSPSGAWAPVHFVVREGVVTIIGVVETIDLKRRVEARCSRVPGVTRVIDQLTVQPVAGGGFGTGKSDTVILKRVRETVLPQIPVTAAVPVDFTVQSGVVTVVGVLPTMSDKQRVATLVRQVPGVVDVNDQITVNIDPVPSQP